MGNYLNQDGKKFYEITHSDIYVDKTDSAEIYMYQPSPPFWEINNRQHDCCLLQPWL